MLIPARKLTGDVPRDGRQHYLPLSQIDYIVQPPESGTSLAIKDLRNNVWRADWRDVRAAFNPVVGTLPAAAGTFLLIAHRFEPTEPYEINVRYPVLGWLVRANGEIEPAVGIGMEFRQATETVILHPSGLIEMPEGTVYDSEELWFENLNDGTVRPI